MRLSTILALLILAGFGVGCLSSQNQAVSPKIEDPTEETVELVGVLDAVDTKNRELTLILTNGTQEEVRVTVSAEVSLNGEERLEFQELSPGNLVNVFGTRDLASLLVTARTVRVTNEPGIVLVTPEPSATVTSPLILEGFADVPEDFVAWRIKDATGVERMRSTVSVTSEQEGFGRFHADLFLPALTAQDFTLDIFAFDTTKREELFLQTISLKLLTTQTSDLNIFFQNDRLNNTQACDIVFPVLRTVAQTSAVGRAALIELLRGPTEEEETEGYRIGLPESFEISSLIISGGVATVDLSSVIVQTLSLCVQKHVYSQITNTLDRVPNVEEVRIILDSDPNQEFKP